MLALNILRGWLYALGAAAVGIGTAAFLLGISVIKAAEALYDIATRGPDRAAAPPWPTFDSEFRFYATLWIAYGVVTVMTARRLKDRLAPVWPLAAIFFAGGVGRAISLLTVGAPHPAFLMLMWTELIAPIGMAGLILAIRSRPSAIDPAGPGR